MAAARTIGAEGTRIHVVQIGGRTPEPHPRRRRPTARSSASARDATGKPLTTALSRRGREAARRGRRGRRTALVRAEQGTTGIDQIAAELKRQMKSELGEKVETVYADVYYYPLGLAILLLIAEVFVGDAPRRRLRRASAAAGRPKAQLRVRRALREKEATAMRRRELRASRPPAAALASRRGGARRRRRRVQRLGPALALRARRARGRPGDRASSTPAAPEPAEEPPRALPRHRPVQRRRGHRAARPRSGRSPTAPSTSASRSSRSASTSASASATRRRRRRRPARAGARRAARRRGRAARSLVVRAIAADPEVPAELRARARYLAGNLEFLRKKYEDAVKEYDQALALVPGLASRTPAATASAATRPGTAPSRCAASRTRRTPATTPPTRATQRRRRRATPPTAATATTARASSDGGDKGDAGQDGGDKGDAGQDGGRRATAQGRRRSTTTAARRHAAAAADRRRLSTSPQQDTRMLEHARAGAELPGAGGQAAGATCAAGGPRWRTSDRRGLARGRPVLARRSRRSRSPLGRGRRARASPRRRSPCRRARRRSRWASPSPSSSRPWSSRATPQPGQRRLRAAARLRRRWARASARRR